VSPHWTPILHLLLLIFVANGAPAFLALLFGRDRAGPLDGGRVLGDGRPLFGGSKTWRGLAAALLLTPLAAWLLGLGWGLGFTVALGAMAGDLLASFLKRRLGLAPSAAAPLLDQVPESLIPALLVGATMGLDWPDLGLVVGTFAVLDLILTPLGKRLGGALRG
jgi:CDP-2,3-bis-(O-geranylgeranyl)-sn-glycerol synthase